MKFNQWFLLFEVCLTVLAIFWAALMRLSFRYPGFFVTALPNWSAQTQNKNKSKLLCTLGWAFVYRQQTAIDLQPRFRNRIASYQQERVQKQSHEDTKTANAGKWQTNWKNNWEMSIIHKQKERTNAFKCVLVVDSLLRMRGQQFKIA